MSRTRVLARPFALWAFAALLAGTDPTPVRAGSAFADETEPVGRRTFNRIAETFPYRPTPPAPPTLIEAGVFSNAQFDTGSDPDLVELPEMTVVTTMIARHMAAAMERDLARLRAEEFSWKTGGRMLRADFGRVRLEAGLWWQLVQMNSSGSPSAQNLPLGARVDLLRISW